MNKPSVLLLTLFGLSTPSLAQDAAPPVRYTVVPFAALSGDVPQRAGAKAAGMLSNELKNTEKLAPVGPQKAASPEPFAEELARAREAVSEAQASRKARKFRLSEESLNKALADYRAAAAAVTDVGEVADAYALLSAVQFNTGRDEEGQRSLRTALALAPTRELPLARTSALFASVVAQTRKEVQEGAKGTLLVESTPSNAAVSVDGVPLGNTPLLVKDVPVGSHLWRVQLPSGEAAGGVVDVGDKKQAKVSGQSLGNDPEARMLASLAQNRLDPALVAAAKEHAAATNAELVVLGALTRTGKDLSLDSFVVTAASGEVKRLPRTRFDTELLSAGVEFYNLAGQLAAKGSKAGEATPVPGPVSPDAAPGRKVAEASYGRRPGAALTLEDPQLETAGKDEPRTPVTPKVRRPLKKK